MGDLYRDISYNFDDSSRKKMISKIDGNFEDSLAMYLTTELGRSSTSISYSSDDGVDSSNSSDGGDDSDTSGSSDDDDGSDPSSCDGDGDGDEEDEGQQDTHLKMFLESLKADGNSYVLKRDGKPDLKFEGLDEDGEDNEMNVVDQGEVSSDCESEPGRREGNDLDGRGGGRKGKGVLREDGRGNSRGVKENGNVDRRAKGVRNVGKKQSFVVNGKGILVEDVDGVAGKRGGKTVMNVESGKEGLVDNVDFRPVKGRERNFKNVEKKQTFVENKKYGSVEQVDLTKVKRRGKNVDKKIVVENESDNSVEEVDIRLDGRRFSRNVKENGKSESKVKNVENVKKQKMVYERNNSVEDVDLRPDGRRFPQNVKENGKLKRRAKDVNVKKVESYKENERDGSMGELGLRLEKLGKVSCKRKRYIDPDYKMFFTHSIIEEGELVFYFNGKRVKYGEDDDDGSLSDSEVNVSDHPPDCIGSKYAPTLNYTVHV